MQEYSAYGDQEPVILGNDVLLKCKIPSFVSDFVSVSSWSDSDGSEFFPNVNKNGMPFVQI